MLASFRAGQLKANTAAKRLGLSRSRFYELYGDYLKACAYHHQSTWTPLVSGGDHAPDWPTEVQALLRKRLSSKPPASYSFAASEALRLHRFKVDRAQVRRWAMEHELAHPRLTRPARASVRRWQRSQIGELWQLDATPHPWFPACPQAFPMLNMLDDCSRVFTGSRIYSNENLLAYLDLLPAAFCEYGLPLEIYVDYHSLFFSAVPKALTQLGQALHFYGITFRYAPTPQAKGKVERAHYFWQQRLPAYFASEEVSDLDHADPHVQALRRHRNQHEVHREIRMTPQKAWNLAQQEKRSVLRPTPTCPWWPFIWSVRTPIKVGPDARVPIGSQLLRIKAAPGSKVILCHHPSGHHSVLASPPLQNSKPLILFTNLPQ
ncbi:MAG: DDE-type integrase/transposase/recombinase [Verrucomicrobia bacterium]|nr:DDE-type integrase/transposase/recombinase [Verrucomicrobiota bacterium]